MEHPTAEEIKNMSYEEIRDYNRKVRKAMLTKIILPKIAISVTIAVVSHIISKAIKDAIDARDTDDSVDPDEED
jgi:hypothetical protein